MVDFNTAKDNTPTPQQTGSSQAASRWDMKDDTWDTLFKGLGTAVTGAADVVDNQNTVNFKQQADAGIAGIRNQYGVDAAADAAAQGKAPPDLSKIGSSDNGVLPGSSPGSTPGTPLPPDVGKTTDQMAKFKARYDAGKMSKGDYYAQLETLSRQVKTQYPGYRDQIDAYITQKTGIQPANAIVANNLAQITAGESSDTSQKKQQWDYFKAHQDAIPLGMQQDFLNGKVSFADVALQVGKWSRDDAVLKNNITQLDYDSKAGTADAGKQTALGTQSADILFKRRLDEMNAVNGFMTKIESMVRSGQAPSSKEVSQLQLAYQHQKMTFLQDLDNWGNTPGTNGLSPAMVMEKSSPGSWSKFKDTQMARLKPYEDAITDGNFGVLTLASRASQIDEDKTYKDIVGNNPALGVVAGIAGRKNLAPLVSDMLNRNDNNILDKASKGVSDYYRMKTQTDPKGSMNDDVEEVKAFEKNQDGTRKFPGLQKSFIDNSVRDLTAPSLPPEVAKARASRLFSRSPDFLKNYTAQDQPTVFAQLTSPAVTQKIQTLAKDDPQIWTDYQNWAKNEFGTVLKSTIDGVNDAKNQGRIGVQWDPQAFQFKVVPTQEGLDWAKQTFAGKVSSWTANPLNAIESYSNSNVEASVRKLNTALKNVQPILKADGWDPNKEFQSLFEGPAAVHLQEKSPSFFQTLRGAINKSNAQGDNQGTAWSDAFGGTHLSFPAAPGNGGVSLTDQNFGIHKVNAPDNGSKMTADNWDLHFYKPQDLTAPTEGGKFVDARAAHMADQLGARFYAETGIRVPVNDSRAYNGGSTAGLRRGTADPGDNPHVGHSQHLLGKAFDFQIQRLSDGQKARFLQMAHEIGFGGIGFYEGSSGHLHLDTGPMRSWGASPQWAGRLQSHTRVNAPPGSLKAYGLGQE